MSSRSEPVILSPEMVDTQKKYGDETILLSEGLTCHDFINLVINNQINHVVQGEAIQEGKNKNLKFAKSIIQDDKKFFDNPVDFMTKNEESRFFNDDFKVFRYIANNKFDKESTVEALLNDVNKLTLRDSTKESCLLIAEELLMNMVYDAPRYFDLLPAEVKAKRIPFRSSELILIYSSELIVFIASDTYGSVDLNKLLSRLLYCYSTDKIMLNMNEGTGGAGYGCRMVYDHSTSLILAVNPGIQSIVAAILPNGISQSKIKRIDKSLHVFKIQE